MKFKIKNIPEQVEIIRAMGHKDAAVARQAQESFASLLSPSIGQMLNLADTTSLVYSEFTFNEDDDPSFPLELFADVGEGHFTIWSQALPGGLPSNTIHEPINEVKFTTYRLDSAYNFLQKYARKTRLDVVGKAIERLMQEILVKTSRNAWSVVLAGLASAAHTVNGSSQKHVVRAQNAGLLTADDLNKMHTLIKRLNMSWNNGTPTINTGSLTDLVVSPEMTEQIRAFAYNPINTKAPLSTTPSAATGPVTIPEDERVRLFNGGGVREFMGVNIIELNEFGKGYAYNTLFGDYAGSTSYEKYPSGGGAVFNGSTTEILLGLDLTKEFAYRAVAINEDFQSTFVLRPDDQFLARSEKIGFWGYLQEGRIMLSTRPVVGLIV
jgi:hypothetical protein